MRHSTHHFAAALVIACLGLARQDAASESPSDAITGPSDFYPSIDSSSIDVAFANAVHSSAFSNFDPAVDIHSFRSAAVMPLARKIRPYPGPSMRIVQRSSQCRGCQPDVRFDTAISMPSPDSYRIDVTISVGDQEGAWSVVRYLDALNIPSPRQGEPVQSMVRRSLATDLDEIGQQACRAITREECATAR